jgi:hypothetical protein
VSAGNRQTSVSAETSTRPKTAELYTESAFPGGTGGTPPLALKPQKPRTREAKMRLLRPFRIAAAIGQPRHG